MQLCTICACFFNFATYIHILKQPQDIRDLCMICFLRKISKQKKKKRLNKLGLSLAKLSSNWNWNWVLIDLRFFALSWLIKILLATLTATSKYLPLSKSSQNLFTSMPTYLHTSLLACFLVCLLAFLLWLAR